MDPALTALTVKQQDYMFALQKEIGVGMNNDLELKRTAKKILDKDDFLILLIAQLTNQDPIQPMEDREFMAQMAQFSSLEQMMNVGKEMAKVSALIGRSQAYSLLGKTVTVQAGEEEITGEVREVRGGDYPQILVEGKYYHYTDVETVQQGAGL